MQEKKARPALGEGHIREVEGKLKWTDESLKGRCGAHSERLSDTSKPMNFHRCGLEKGHSGHHVCEEAACHYQWTE
jgi:hypothetical protein